MNTNSVCRTFASIMSILMMMAGVQTLHAQWSSDPTQNTEVNTWSDETNRPLLAPDGNGGVLIVWTERNDGIYAQHLDKNGYIQWSSSGVSVGNASGNQNFPQIVSNDSGGATIVWQDGRQASQNSDIYANRIDSTGTLHWADDHGFPVCTATGNQTTPLLIPDGAGGAIIAWIDARSGSGIYAQRISRDGAAQWQANGSKVLEGAGVWGLAMTTDGSGGAIIAWVDMRDGENLSNVYAQRLNASGERTWIAGSDSNGIAICTAPGHQQEPSLLSTNDSGAVIVWRDRRMDDYSDLYAQRIDKNGNVLWQQNGIPVCTLPSAQGPAVLAGDDSGGVYVAWANYDGYYWTQYDLFLQHLSADGVRLWTTGADTNGVPIAADTVEEKSQQLMKDGTGGVFVVWTDNRTGDYNVYGQRFTSIGARLWRSGNDSSGVPISTAPEGQWIPQVQPDAGDGIIVVWQDDRAWSAPDIYAQQVNRSGALGIVTNVQSQDILPIEFSLGQNYPNPFNPFTIFDFRLPIENHVTLKVYDVLGREVATLVNEVKQPGEYTVRWDASNFPSGVYFYRLIAHPRDGGQAGLFTEIKKMILAK